jgi:hypothetical protein
MPGACDPARVRATGHRVARADTLGNRRPRPPGAATWARTVPAGGPGPKDPLDRQGAGIIPRSGGGHDRRVGGNGTPAGRPR